MKLIKYLIIALFGLYICSCADETPELLGVCNPKATVSQITATTASVTIDLTDCAELLPTGDCLCRITLHDETGYKDFEYFYVRSHKYPEKLELIHTVSFKYLKPSTTYHFDLEIPVTLGPRKLLPYKSDKFTFTTAPE